MQNQIFEKINKTVIDGLKAKGLSWFKPWKAGQANAPFNLVTDRFYNGFNIFILNYEMIDKGYEYNQWLTFKQVSAKGGKVVKGSKSTEVYFWQIGYLDNSTGKFVAPKLVKSINSNERMSCGKLRYLKTFSVKFYKVFNVAQCTGIDPKVIEDTTSDVNNEPNVVAETLSKSYIDKQGTLKLVHLEDSAYYSPNRDIVNMPKLDTFVDADSYYKVLFHELAHSTGHKDRLNRKTLLEVNKWGDTTYAKEELVAEISAMYIVGMLGLEPKDNESNSQAYIKGWCKYLEDKPKECVYAMQQATKVVDYINQ
jgi:antirestriction protein ArdC